MNKIKTVLFDYDGTLMDTNQVVYNSWQHTFRELTGKDGDKDLIYSTYGEPLSVCIKRIFKDVNTETALNIYREYQSKHFSSEVLLFAGVKDLLIKLKSDGYRLGIVTSRLRSSTMAGLKAKGIEDVFEVIVTTEDTKNHKPHGEPIEKAIELMKVKKEECIYIGDTSFDLLCAKNAGVPSVMVGWAVAFQSQKEEGGIRADYIMESPEDLFKIL